MSDQSKALVVHPKGVGFEIFIPAEALRLKEQALAKGSPISKVTNADEQSAAILAASVIKGLVAETEKTRKLVKQPYWDAGKAIDAKAEEYKKELEAESARLEKLVAGFQRAERDKAEAQKREAEKAQREAEAKAERQRAQLAEIERQRAMAEVMAANAKRKKDREAAAAEAERLENERIAAQIDAMEAEDDAAAATVTVIAPAAPSASGATVKFVREFEVTDIDALYAYDLQNRNALAEKIGKPLSAIPSWFRMEVRKNEVNDFVATLPEDKLDSIPGLKITLVAKAAVRGVSPAIFG